MGRLCCVATTLGAAVLALVCGCSSGSDFPKGPPANPSAHRPVRKEFPPALATQLEALGCEGFEWRGESRVFAQKPLADQTLAQVAELVADLPNLGLSLDSSRMTDEGISRLSRLRNLRSLCLSGGGVTDAGLARVPELGRLEGLLLLNNKRITDAGLVHLGQMSHLKELTLSRTKVTNEGLLHLKGVENLEKLLVEPLLANVEQVPELHDALVEANGNRMGGGTVQVVDAATGRVQHVCPALPTRPPTLMFSADGAVAALVESYRVLLLDTQTGVPLQEILTSKLDGERHNLGIWHAALSPDGNRIALARQRARLYMLHVVDTHTKKVIARFPKELSQPWDLRFSSDGGRLLVMSTPVYLWDLTSGEITARFQPVRIDTAHHGVFFSPDERKVVTATSGEVQLWDIANQACEIHWNRERAYLYVRGVFFDRSGSLLVLATPGDSALAARLHDAATGRLVGKLDFPVEIFPSTHLTLAPDGRRVAYHVGARRQKAHHVGGQIHVCDLSTGKLLTVVELRNDHCLHRLTFTPDGNRLIVHSWSTKQQVPGNE